MTTAMERLIAKLKHRTRLHESRGFRGEAERGGLADPVVEEGPPAPDEVEARAAVATTELPREAGVEPVKRARSELVRAYEDLFGRTTDPRQMGRYAVLDKLGEGGMGVVLKAYDRELDRQVALKVLHPELDEQFTQRLRREAQAMAKLSHPNVVQVYEVGEIEGRTFVALELVKGQALDKWMRQRPRPSWRECVNVFLQLGAGLAAAHERGLVHRDFKPANAILDDKGRARVLDFGLARRFEGIDDSTSVRTCKTKTGPSGLDAMLTRSGTVLGTPAYMPPEQMNGHEADARSDQFSFCVSLYEAVYGERPFAGRTLEALMVSLAGGAVRPVPKGSKIPGTLRAVLLRGLAVGPAERWSSMEVLLGELRRLVAPRTRRGLVLGLTVGLLGMGAALGVPEYLEMQARCSSAEDQLDGVWDEERRQEVEDAVLGTDLSYAADTWARIEPRLDEYAHVWVGKHTEVCEATSVKGEQTEEAMELRMGCLHERKVALAAAVTVLADADATVVEKAVQLVEALPSMDRCDDVERLEHMHQRVPPPEDPLVEQEVQALREQLAGVKAELDAGRYADALEHVEPVAQRAEALGYGPLMAEVLAQRGDTRQRMDELVAAERDLEQAFTLAAEHGHDAVAVKAVDILTWVVGVRQGRHEPGVVWGRTALALSRGPEVETTAQASSLGNIGNVLQMQGKLEEALTHYHLALAIYQQAFGEQHFYVAAILGNIGNVLQFQGKLEEALTHYHRALAIYQQAFGKQHSSVALILTNIGHVLQLQGKLEEALTYHQRALAISEQALGKQHSKVADTLTNIGIVLQMQGKLEEALTHHHRALAISEQALGKQHSTGANTLTNIGSVLQMQGKLEEALTHHHRALAIFEQALGKQHPTVATILTNIGIVLQMQGKFEEALTHHHRALAIFEQALGKQHSSVANTLTNIGAVLQMQGKLEEAVTHYHRALAIFEQALGKQHSSIAALLTNIGIVLQMQGKLEEALIHHHRALAIYQQALGKHHPALAYPLLGLANVALDQREFDTARAHAERAVSIREAGEVAPPLVAEARFTLARALWNDRAGRKRAHALAQQARDAMAATEGPSETDVDITEVDTWLAKHRAR